MRPHYFWVRTEEDDGYVVLFGFVEDPRFRFAMWNERPIPEEIFQGCREIYRFHDVAEDSSHVSFDRARMTTKVLNQGTTQERERLLEMLGARE